MLPVDISITLVLLLSPYKIHIEADAPQSCDKKCQQAFHLMAFEDLT